MPPELVELARWIADEYCSTPARALGLLLPPGVAAGRGRKQVAGRRADRRPGAHGARRTARASTDRQRALLRGARDDGPTVAATLGTAALRRLETRGLRRRRPA